jgi:tRNA A37 methylthiotransferase MiaB
MKSFYVFNTGCVRRALDSERIYNYFTTNGWRFTRNVGRADLLVVMTCGVITENEDRSIHTLERVLQKKSPNARVVVSGCLPKINLARIEETGTFEYVPTGDLDAFDAVIDADVPFASIPEPSTFSTESDTLDYILAHRIFRSHTRFIGLFDRLGMRRAFLKSAVAFSKLLNVKQSLARARIPQKIVPYYNIRIGEGCLSNCTFCATRFATGLLKSRPPDDIIADLKECSRSRATISSSSSTSTLAGW